MGALTLNTPTNCVSLYPGPLSARTVILCLHLRPDSALCATVTFCMSTGLRANFFLVCPRIAWVPHRPPPPPVTLPCIRSFPGRWQHLRGTNSSSCADNHSDSQAFPEHVHARLGLLVHQNLIRPGTAKSLARPLPRRIHAHLRSEVLHARGVIQRVYRT